MTRIKRIAAWVAAIVLTLTMAFVGITPANAFSASNAEAVVASAATNENAFDATSVNDDLKGMNLDELLPDSITEPSAVKFVEYCFGDAAIKCGNYALYLYVYNPTKKQITPFEAVNKIEIATEYNEKGDPSKYDKLSLRLCGISTGNIEGLVYKYRVLDENSKVLNNALAQDEKSGERRYDVSGFELWEIGTDGAKEYKVAKIYRYTGYAEGYGAAGEESTLTCTSQLFEAISLKPSFTNYRMPSEYKDDTRLEVNTAYFSLDDYFFEEYGKLQKIHAQWYEYKTDYMFVTEDEAAYNALYDYVGVNIGERNDSVGVNVWSNWYTHGNNSPSAYMPKVPVDIGYNEISSYSDVSVISQISQINWLFKTGTNLNGEAIEWENYKVSKSEVEEWARDYCLGFGKTADILGKYSSELFIENIDENRLRLLKENQDKPQSHWTATRGLVDLNIDADEDKNLLLSYADTHSDWERFWDYLFKDDAPADVNSNRPYSPIHVVTEEDLLKTNSEFSEEFLVDEAQAGEIKAYCSAELLAGRRPVLFRFAQTDYYAREMYFHGEEIKTNDYNGYIAKETVFLNFDLIDLTFRSEEGVDTVIPVVMDPVDVFNGLDPAIVYGPDWDELLKLILSVIGVIILILIVVLFWGPVKAVLGLVWDIISAPFKWLWNIFKGGGKK